MPPDERELVNGIPTTSFTRTILDLAGIWDRHRVEQLIARAEHENLTAVRSLPDLLERYPRRRGTPLLRAILEQGTVPEGLTNGEFEQRFAELIDAQHLPRPAFNAPLEIDGSPIYADALWREQRLIVELDGAGNHSSNRQRSRDAARDRALVLRGFRVVRVTWRQLEVDGEKLAMDLRDLLDTPRR